MITDSRAKTVKQGPNSHAAIASCPSRCPVDVNRYVAEMERVLDSNHDRSACLQAIEILQRWQFDEMLDVASQERARVLVLRFAHSEHNEWATA
jgi:hypothetical protein